MRLVEQVAGELMLAALAKEEAGEKPVLYGTMDDLGAMLGRNPSVVSAAFRLTRKPEWIKANGYTFPSLGNGRPGKKYGYTLEYTRDGAELAEAQLLDHAVRLRTSLQSLTSQYTLASEIVDGRTAIAKKIGMVLKAVDLAAAALDVGTAEEASEMLANGAAV